jgi:hypothetical protein
MSLVLAMLLLAAFFVVGYLAATDIGFQRTDPVLNFWPQP